MAKNSGAIENENYRRDLFDNAMQGMWDKVMELYEQQRWLRREKITEGGDTALHIAVLDHKERVVEEMVKLLRTPPKDMDLERPQGHEDVLKLKNEQGNTPLHLAASIGNVSMCKCLVGDSEDLVGICNNEGENPLFFAARHGEIEAFIFLQGKVSEPNIGSYIHRRNKKGETILHYAIAGGHLKLAFLIIEKYENLGSGRDETGVSPLHLLAKQPTAFRSGTRLSLTDKIIYPYAEKCHDPAERQNFPVNYGTCFNFIKLLIKAILGILFLALGPSYINKIQHKKEKHVWSAKILKKLLDKGKGRWYDSTGKNPLYKERTIQYEGENLGEGRGPDLSLKMPEMNLEYVESSKQETSENGFGNSMHKLLEEVQRSTNCMHKLLEEVQRSIDLIHRLLKQAQRSRLLTVNKSQKWHKSLNDDSNWALMQTMCEAIRQAAKKLDDELLSETEVKNQEQGKLETPILIAAKNGIKEMVESILDCSPMAIHDVSSEKKNAVLLAVENRHPHVLKVLLKRANYMTDSVFGAVDNDGNSALHLAAMFIDKRPWLTPGAALQMQWEVKWFEYVKNSVGKNFLPIPNKNNEVPQQIFTDKHKDLVQKGGEWLNSTATACSMVSTLIATVAFATSVTSPGGNKENTGMPVLEVKPAFHLFAISSLVALCFSITATIMFLAILTSRHQEKDFAKELPNKLLAGLSSLFVSILAILVSFCSAHFFVLQKELRSYALPIYAVTCLPATLFAIAQLPLYIDLLWATFRTMPQPSLEDDS